MRERSITHPAKEPLLIIRRWQLVALDGNQCAAALLSFFEYWHDIKTGAAEQNRKIGENSHGLIQWHTQEELEQGILGLYKRDMIRKAINLLEEKGFISILKNPQKRYGFDRTRHFLFHEENVRKCIDSYLSDSDDLNYKNEKSATVTDYALNSTNLHRNDFSIMPIGNSLQQRLHAESTIGDYLVPSLISKAKLDSPLERKFAPLANQSVSDLTEGIAITPLDAPSVPMENTPFLSVRDCADTHAAQGGLFASELPVSDSKTTLGYRDTFSGDSVQPCPVSAKKRATVKSASRKKPAQTETDPRATHPAIVAFRDIVLKFPKKPTWDQIIAIIGDSPDRLNLEKCYVEAVMRGPWCSNGYKWVEWYRDGIPEYGVKPKKQKEVSKYGTFDFDKYAKRKPV